jgi:hypothetical protein
MEWKISAALGAGERDFALEPALNESPLPVDGSRRAILFLFGERPGEGTSIRF